MASRDAGGGSRLVIVGDGLVKALNCTAGTYHGDVPLPLTLQQPDVVPFVVG